MTVKSFFALISVQKESTLGKQRSSVGFCSSNSEMNKELTNCQRSREHMNICASLMSRLIYGPMIWYQTSLVLSLWPGGWIYQDQKLVAVIYQVAPAPVSVLQLVRCSCEKSKRSQRFSCRGNTMVCTELCKCGGEGDNYAKITQPMIGEYIEDWTNGN